MKTCDICGALYAEPHHLIFGRPYRKACDADGLIIWACRACHNQIHKDGVATKLSKMLGQKLFEANGGNREEFIKRYGREWLE